MKIKYNLVETATAALRERNIDCAAKCIERWLLTAEKTCYECAAIQGKLSKFPDTNLTLAEVETLRLALRDRIQELKDEIARKPTAEVAVTLCNALTLRTELG